MKPSKNNIINDYTKYQKLPSDFELNSSNNFMPREAREAIIAVSLCCFFFFNYFNWNMFAVGGKILHKKVEFPFVKFI